MLRSVAMLDTTCLQRLSLGSTVTHLWEQTNTSQIPLSLRAASVQSDKNLDPGDISSLYQHHFGSIGDYTGVYCGFPCVVSS